MSAGAPPATLVPSTDGVRLAVHDFGGPSDRDATTLLFAHATGLHGQVWGPAAAPLTDRYRCLALDFRGHGLSDTPPGTDLSWPRMGDDLLAVLDSGLIATGEVVGVGHSMGGAALVLAVARRPRALRSLWLYEPAIIAPGVGSAGNDNPMADGALRRRASFASFDEAFANYAGKPPFNQLRPDALEAYVRGGFEPGPDGRVTLRCLPATEAEVFRGGGTSGAFDALAGLDLPVALIAGQPEPFSPVVYIDAALAQLSHGTLVRRPQLGHFGPLQDPAGTADDIASWVEANR
jgi:pimeloyl-ACP methyl ester carboxylesterase